MQQSDRLESPAPVADIATSSEAPELSADAHELAQVFSPEVHGSTGQVIDTVAKPEYAIPNALPTAATQAQNATAVQPFPQMLPSACCVPSAQATISPITNPWSSPAASTCSAAPLAAPQPPLDVQGLLRAMLAPLQKQHDDAIQMLNEQHRLQLESQQNHFDHQLADVRDAKSTLESQLLHARDACADAKQISHDLAAELSLLNGMKASSQVQHLSELRGLRGNQPPRPANSVRSESEHSAHMSHCSAADLAADKAAQQLGG